MFYENLKREILQLIADSQHQTALTLIEQELNVPYIPQDFESFLHAKRKEVLTFLSHSSQQSIPNIGIHEVERLLKSNDTNDYLIALEMLEKVNIRHLEPAIKDFLLRADVPNDFKSLTLIALQRQNVAQPFKVRHNTALLEINPQQLPLEKLTRFNHQVTKKLQTVFFNQNQSLTNLAIKIAVLFVLDIFPQDFYFSVADVAAMAIKRAGSMLNEKITWSQIEAIFPFDRKIASTIFRHQLPSLD